VTAPRTVLVVEDSPTQAEVLRALLEAGGYVARVARSAEDALVVLDAAPGTCPDLVLSDVVMPGMSGFDLCRILKTDPTRCAIPVVLLTSLADPLDVVRGLEAGADNYITKPYDPEHLLARLAHVFATRALRAAPRADGAVPITFLGHEFAISAGKEQILDVLTSSFEELVRANAALQAAQAERARLHERERRARLEAEEARRRAEDARLRAEEANRAKSDFLAMMSHDLRTPLNAIGGYAELLALGVRGPVTPEQTADLERIKRNQTRLLGLVNDLLNFARLERGEVPMDLRPVPLHDTLAGMQAVIEPQVRAKAITYAYLACDPALAARADRERMEQVLVNLLTNAVKFTPDGGRIVLSCAADDGEVAVEVADTGVGIPADKLDAIFDPFVQVDARRHGEREGVGLGLAISRDLARRMGGDLTVRSVIGEGATFRFTLPRDGAPAATAVSATSATSAAARSRG
jgi:two-component system, sensor histidine kinase and response regulator